jgi:phage gpG-like protein
MSWTENIMSTLLKVVGYNYFHKKMAERAKKLKEMERVNQKATVLVDRWIQKNFAESGVPAMGGAGWKPLSAMTILMRRKKPGGKLQILQATGTLRSKWKHLWTRNLAKVQSGVDYAKQHHEGWGPLPVRRILPLDRQISPELEKLFKIFIGDGLK